MSDTEKDTNPNRLTIEDIQRCIINTQFHFFEGTTATVCCLTLENGFSVIGESACVYPEDFTKEKGRKYSFDDAVNKAWAHEAYLLKSRLSGQ